MWHFLCKIGIHSYEDEINFEYTKASTDSVPCMIRQICKRCGKIRKEVTGSFSLKECTSVYEFDSNYKKRKRNGNKRTA